MISSVKSLFSVKDDDPTLAIAQQAALSKQIPLMYFILMVNTWGVAITHLPVAPFFLTVIVPSVMTAACAFRMLQWGLRVRRPATNADQAIAELRRTNRIAWVLAGIFAGWGIGLTPYGDSFMQSHVAFYMGITVIGCIFCLTHLLPAAMAVTFVVNIAFVAYFGLTGNAIFMAMAVDVGLVSAAMLMVLWVQYRDFTHLVVSRRELENKKNALEKRELELVDEQRQTEALSEENRKLANMDSLTGLANRRFFFSSIDEMIGQLTPLSDPIHLGLIDLDGFKPVNDVHGHKAGDELLSQLASRLARTSHGRALVARLGGDEFAFLLQTADPAAPKKLAEEICGVCREPFVIADAMIEVGASIGFASSALCREEMTRLYDQADFALYQAKRNAPGTAVAFSPEHHHSLSRLTVIEHAFRDGSVNQHLSLAFQPIFDVASNAVTAFEALARWHHPVLGPVSPAEFIPVAERLGHITHLTRALLSMALQEARFWPRHIRLSFNLSARDLSSSDHAMRLLALIANSGIEPSRIDLEITETAILTDLERARVITEAFRSAGIGISLDDFGTGYSSLMHLHSMPLTKIKIDRSFVTKIEDDPASVKIVRSLIRMADDMGLDCIVEGVETKAEMATICDLGGRFIQGYHISRPLTAADARAVAEGARASLAS